jgi:predicted TIM-barrel fold metal-dependent hydrolase
MTVRNGLNKKSVSHNTDMNDECTLFPEKANFDLMSEVMKFRKIDAHVHVYWPDFTKILGWVRGSPETQIFFGKKLRIEKQVISRYLNVMPGSPEQFRKYNNLTIEAMKKYPDNFLGGFVINGAYQKESLEEINRCMDAGMIGTGELYYHVKINDPRYYPIIEKLIDLKMIIHFHAECQLGVGGYRMKYKTTQAPNTSIPEDFVDIAKRYPEGIFQFAHIGMGGDWEYECKMFADYPNIYVETGGSNNSENMIDFAVKHIGEDRIFFGSDGAYFQGIGKILASNLTDRQKQKIFFDNYNNVLKLGGRNVD